MGHSWMFFKGCSNQQLASKSWRTFMAAVENASSNSSLRRRTTVHGSSSRGYRTQTNPLFIPGATVATLMMLGALHVRRMYDDKQSEQSRRHDKEVEFLADWKATFLQLLPLRFISRTWGSVTSVELPIWMRSFVYKSWARAFSADLDEAGRPLEEYGSLKDFFTRELKHGSRPLDQSSACLLSPVDGIVLRYGKIRGSGTMIEQVKGLSYSVFSLLGADSSVAGLFEESTSLPDNKTKQLKAAPSSDEMLGELPSKRLGSQAEYSRVPSVQQQSRLNKEIFYCVLYLGPGDYHRIHSPSDWDIFKRCHIYGRLFPVNERAVRTIKNLYVANERVILEGKWSQGFLAMVAVGATTVGSIGLKFEPELRTNQPKMFRSSGSSRTYGENGAGIFVKAGEEVAVFNLGSTVVLVFQAPAALEQDEHGARSMALKHSDSTANGFLFTVQSGERVKVGQALGKW